MRSAAMWSTTGREALMLAAASPSMHLVPTMASLPAIGSHTHPPAGHIPGMALHTLLMSSPCWPACGAPSTSTFHFSLHAGCRPNDFMAWQCSLTQGTTQAGVLFWSQGVLLRILSLFQTVSCTCQRASSCTTYMTSAHMWRTWRRMLINLWPGFGGALADQTQNGPVMATRFYGIANTIMCLAGSSLAAFAASSGLGNKLNMVHIQNSTLAGGVAISSACEMNLTPAGVYFQAAVLWKH